MGTARFHSSAWALRQAALGKDPSSTLSGFGQLLAHVSLPLSHLVLSLSLLPTVSSWVANGHGPFSSLGCRGCRSSVVLCSLRRLHGGSTRVELSGTLDPIPIPREGRVSRCGLRNVKDRHYSSHSVARRLDWETRCSSSTRTEYILIMIYPDVRRKFILCT